MSETPELKPDDGFGQAYLDACDAVTVAEKNLSDARAAHARLRARAQDLKELRPELEGEDCSDWHVERWGELLDALFAELEEGGGLPS